MMTHDEMIAVIAAHRDGKVIQYSYPDQSPQKWSDIEEPRFNFLNCNYRIKPEPIDAWAVVTANGVTFGVYQYRHFAESAVNSAASDLRIVRLVAEGGDA